MNLMNLFVRNVPDSLTVEELTGALAAARLRLASRDTRVAKLTAQLQRQRETCAAAAAKQNDMIASLQAQLGARSRGSADDSDQLQSVKRDLAAAFELLDEFEADAQRGHAAVISGQQGGFPGAGEGLPG